MRYRWSLATIGLLILAACNLLSFVEPAPNTTNVDLTVTAVIAANSTTQAHLLQTQSVQLLTNAPCAFMWATQELPDLSAEITAAMDAVLNVDVSVRAYAFGENCVANGAVRSFGAMQTDFDMNLTFPTLEDREVVGDAIANAFTVLMHYPPSSTPGPNSGRITLYLIAQTGGEAVVLQVNYTRADNAIAQGLSGATLLDALEGSQ